MLPYAEYGVAIFAITALVFVICKFLKFIKCQNKSSTQFMENHVESSTRASQRLADMIEAMLGYLERQDRN